MAEANNKTDKSESVEDILQSIKRIIEDDTGTDAKPPGDVLDLTQVVKDDKTVTPIPPLPRPKAQAPEDVVKSIDAMFAPEPAAPPAPPAAAAAPEKNFTEDLVSEKAAMAAMAALKPIVDSGQKDFSIPHLPSAHLRDGTTVEDLVLEALRPMLKSWLDEYLPTIVQKIVEREVRRIVNFHHD